MKLGVMEFTMMQDFMQDFYGTLKKVSDLGLKYVEWLPILAEDDYGLGEGVFKGTKPQEAVKIFAEYGMEITGCIFASNDPENIIFDYDKMQRIIDWYGEAGATTVGIANDYFCDEEFFKRRMEAYNEIGRRCKDAGMTWVYHNHFHEQQKINGETVLDLMCKMTDPECVGFDWDVYWGVRGLADPVETIRKLGTRIKRFHCKDYPFSQLGHIDIARDLPVDELVSFKNQDRFSAYQMIKPEDFIECGKGIIKWQEVVDEANKLNIPYMFVEQDYTTYEDKFESLKDSVKYLLNLNGLTVD